MFFGQSLGTFGWVLEASGGSGRPSWEVLGAIFVVWRATLEGQWGLLGACEDHLGHLGRHLTAKGQMETELFANMLILRWFFDDFQKKSSGQVLASAGTWWQVVASAGTPGGIRGAARLRQKLSEFDRF